MIRLFPPDKMEAHFELPISKSMFNRALVIACQTQCRILAKTKHLPEDCRVMMNYLQACGFAFQVDDGVWTISSHLKSGQYIQADLAMAGTAMRFLTSLACILPLNSEFTGAARLGERPYLPLAMAMNQAGASILCHSDIQVFPIKVTGNPDWQPGNITLSQIRSSQMVSAVLLLGPHFNLGTSLFVSKDFPLSEPYIKMTLDMLEQQGMHWTRIPLGYQLHSKKPRNSDIIVEPDWSAVSYILGMLLLKGGELTIHGLKQDSCQGDAAQLSYFRQLGLHFEFYSYGLKASSSGRTFSGFQFDFSDMPDQAQTFAVLAALAHSPSRLTGLESLTLKETDRITALEFELRKLNAQVTRIPGGLEIVPGILPEHAEIKTYQDHRMAMAFSMAATQIPGIRIQAPEVVDKSFPHFWQELSQVGFRFE